VLLSNYKAQFYIFSVLNFYNNEELEFTVHQLGSKQSSRWFYY